MSFQTVYMYIFGHPCVCVYTYVLCTQTYKYTQICHTPAVDKCTIKYWNWCWNSTQTNSSICKQGFYLHQENKFFSTSNEKMFLQAFIFPYFQLRNSSQIIVNAFASSALYFTVIKVMTTSFCFLEMVAGHTQCLFFDNFPSIFNMKIYFSYAAADLPIELNDLWIKNNSLRSSLKPLMCLKLSICLSALLDQGQDAYYSAEPFVGKPVYAI